MVDSYLAALLKTIGLSLKREQISLPSELSVQKPMRPIYQSNDFNYNQSNLRDRSVSVLSKNTINKSSQSNSSLLQPKSLLNQSLK